MTDLKKLLILLGLGSVIGLLVGLARGVIQYKHDGWLNFTRGVIASILVAILVSFGLDAMIWPDSMKAAVTGVCSYVADDILVATLTLAQVIRSDPVEFISRWIPVFKKDKE